MLKYIHTQIKCFVVVVVVVVVVAVLLLLLLLFLLLLLSLLFLLQEWDHNKPQCLAVTCRRSARFYRSSRYVSLVLNRAITVSDSTAHFDSEHDLRTGCPNVSHCQKQSYLRLRSPGRSCFTYWNDSQVQTFQSCNTFFLFGLSESKRDNSCPWPKAATLPLYGIPECAQSHASSE